MKKTKRIKLIVLVVLIICVAVLLLFPGSRLFIGPKLTIDMRLEVDGKEAVPYNITCVNGAGACDIMLSEDETAYVQYGP